MTASEGVIRLARESDNAALYDICLKTANAGGDASSLYSDPQYPGQRFSVPYLYFAAPFAFVLEQASQVTGYVVAAPDTVLFEEALAQHWWPRWQDAYRDRQAQAERDDDILGAIRQPERAATQLTSAWPAHLHINLLPSAQGGGWGRRMVETELRALREAGVKGVHLGVSLQNEAVCAFYQRLGFRHVVRSHAIYMARTL
ncbi:GNAT family N-acetyltransferase [Dickeya dianthicola]|uniref:GNAT family N-acetyltransferase n=1 Tax=Dickeya dianthicola TaxID=204039 RepID=UPI0004176E1A|nr:GNAT family N-acetyltransferase [Dickeya dianthicola]MZG41452.1 GNAT family N-acetyltransferase [Dickeya dianthicola]